MSESPESGARPQDSHNYEFEYDVCIHEDAPLAPQPERINIPLKPHQLASLHKATVMETRGEVRYNVTSAPLWGTYRRPDRYEYFGKSKMSTNIGIFGDAIGSGKTVLALSLVAAVPTKDIMGRKEVINTFEGHAGGFAKITREYDRLYEEEEIYHSTLIVVPRGPVYTQFEEAIDGSTNLRILRLDNIHTIKAIGPPPDATQEVLKTFFERYDATLIKNTTLKLLMEYYRHLNDRWDRIIVDEAVDILRTIPALSYGFLWLISATYNQLLGLSCARNKLAGCMHDRLFNTESIHLAAVRCDDAFVARSFDVPAPIVTYHICHIQRQLAAVHSFLSPNVRERINANDMMGALQLMGATTETENDVVSLLTKEIERDIANRRREIAYINTLEIPADNKATRLQVPTADLTRLEGKLHDLIERVTALETKTCPVCYDALENPLLLPCSHVFCTRCLISWMEYNHNTCPTCRQPVESRQLVSIVKDTAAAAAASAAAGASASSAAAAPDAPSVPKSKEATMLDILKANPTGRFVVFSKLDSSYWGSIGLLTENNISFNLLKGNSYMMAGILERFRNGQTQVLLLNTTHAASGIDISMATDMIIIHDLGEGRTQAVGRCNRHPRTVPLRIHQLCYPQEMTSAPVDATYM